jgi:serine/threonine-protein phosphatase 2A regulatory subunit B'
MPHDFPPPRFNQKLPLIHGVIDNGDTIPKALGTPKRLSSRFDISIYRALEYLPGFRRRELFMQKINQCNNIFGFNDARHVLYELLDYIANNRQVITGSMYPRAVHMFARNLFRPNEPPI